VISEDQLHVARLRQFERLSASIIAALAKFGRADSLFLDGDFSLVSDYWGYPQVKVNVLDLRLLYPDVIASLQKTLVSFREWEIVVAVALREHHDWPDMGLYIRKNEIVDGLNREYLPASFRNIRYGSGGTERQV
jgi:hypothetical protein